MCEGQIQLSYMDNKSEVSQKEKNRYHMLTHIYGIKKKKKGSDEPRGRTGVEMQT